MGAALLLIGKEQRSPLVRLPDHASLAALLGMSGDQLAGKVAELLPQVVDGLTPDGQLPSAEGTDMAQALGSLSAILGRG